MSIQRGELKVLIDLLERDPTGVNACDEVRYMYMYNTCIWFEYYHRSGFDYKILLIANCEFFHNSQSKESQ